MPIDITKMIANAPDDGVPAAQAPPVDQTSQPAGPASQQPPPTFTANGGDLPPQTGTAGAMSPEAEATSAAAAPIDISKMIAASPDTDSSNSTQNPGVASRFGTGFAEGSQTEGLGTAIKQAVTQPSSSEQQAMDYFRQALDAFKQGDEKTAHSAATNFMLTATKAGLEKAFSPHIKVIDAILLNPIKAIQDQRAINQKVQADEAAGKSNPNSISSVVGHAKQDWNNNNPDAALTDVLSGTLGQPGVEGFPVVGSMVRHGVNDLDRMTHRTVDGQANPDTSGEFGYMSGALAAPIISKVFGLAGETAEGVAANADTVSAANKSIASSPGFAEQAAQHDALIRSKLANIDTNFNAAQAERDSAIEAQAENNQQAKNSINDTRDAAQSALKSKKAQADAALDQGEQIANSHFQGSLKNEAQGAPAPQDLAPKVNEGINAYESKAHSDYDAGLKNIGPRLDGETAPAPSSEGPIQQQAKDLLNNPRPDDHPDVAALKNISQGGLDSKVKAQLQSFADGQAPPRNASTLIAMRQQLRAAAAGFERGNVNQQALSKMIGAVDQTLDGMATATGDAGVMNDYKQLRQNYATARQNLDSSVADKLNLDSPDQAMGDVNKYLLQGNNSAAKIRTIGSMVGEDTMQGLRQSYLQQLSEMDPEKALSTLGGIPEDTRQAFFGPELDARVQQAMADRDTLMEHATQSHADATMGLGEPNKEAINKHAENATQTQAANNTAAKKVIADKLEAARASKTTAAEPFTSKFARDLSSGDITENLANKKVSLSELRAFKAAVPKDWEAIQKAVYQQGENAATTGGNFNPAKFLKWLDGMDPDVQHEMFGPAGKGLKAGQAGPTTPLADKITALTSARTQQRLVRAGLATTVGIPAAKGIALLPGPLAYAIDTAGLLGEGVVRHQGFGSLAVKLLDHVASHPATWKTFGVAKFAAPALKAARYYPVGSRVIVDGQHHGTVTQEKHPDSGLPVIKYDGQ
jgi:hypothetical protein